MISWSFNGFSGLKFLIFKFPILPMSDYSKSKFQSLPLFLTLQSCLLSSSFTIDASVGGFFSIARPFFCHRLRPYGAMKLLPCFRQASVSLVILLVDQLDAVHPLDYLLKSVFRSNGRPPSSRNFKSSLFMRTHEFRNSIAKFVAVRIAALLAARTLPAAEPV